ncbi:uncharacterized protein LOC106170651 [Lingula anatina]|uniref:Uncharacterized protein LOC106170651 n=1 Tax=Lingula anatina TaxID=7574 RepID=A0A1S3J6Z4_LINAN|nr:uncharacterized protein LOC106170651 [Lingula anatina]|eukprot:XP_013406078.1 uncharacterized protein LOC106170651 [Lingula anatina]
MNSQRLSEIEAEILAVESAIDKTYAKLREHFYVSSSPKTSTPKAATLQPQSTIPSSLNESTLVKELSKPKIEILPFEGDPIHYTQFIRQFNSRVANICDSPDEKISYLLQYIRGEARKIVQRRYGEEEYVAQSYIKKATQWPNVKPGDISALDNFGIFLRECHYAVGSIASTTILEYPENIKKLSQKLPQPMQDRWRSHAYKKKEKGLKVTFETLVDFVQREARILTDPIYGKNSLPENPPRKKATVHNIASSTSTVPAYQPRHNPANQTPSVTPVPESSCLYQENHTISKCTQFINKSTEERREFAKARRLCFNCLKGSHRAQECRNPGRWRHCAKKHHTLLHQLRESAPVGNAVLSTGTGDSDHKAFFQLLPVHVMSNGRTIETEALLDSASQMTIIKESLAFDLGLNGETCALTVNTLNSSSHVKSKNVSFLVKSESAPPLNIRNAKTLPVNKFQCSEQRLNPEWFHCQNLGIPNVITPSEVGLLIGVDQPEAHIQYGIRRGSKDQPIAVQTYLGWSLIGTDSHLSQSSPLSVNLLSVSDQSLEQFWSTETFGVSYQYSNPFLTEDRKAEAMLDKSKKLVNGNYEVGMLWKSEKSTLPNNLEMAKDRYRLLNKRFEKDRNFEEKYRGIMRDNISRGYARKLTPEEAGLCSQRTWYLPHHAVTNTQKGKLRLVYDAAATYKGVSLNKALMTGPDLLNSLFGVIQRFRLYEIAMVADIEQMFMQVHVPSSDADSLRFLYSEDNNPDAFEVYQMTSHIFGAKDSPACANYALRRTAQDHACTFIQ